MLRWDTGRVSYAKVGAYKIKLPQDMETLFQKCLFRILTKEERKKVGGGVIVIFFTAKCIRYKIRILEDSSLCLPRYAHLEYFTAKILGTMNENETPRGKCGPGTPWEAP